MAPCDVPLDECTAHCSSAQRPQLTSAVTDVTRKRAVELFQGCAEVN